MMKPLTPLLLILATGMMFAGCSSLNRVRFTVEPSSLDYAQFRISRPSPAGTQPETLRLDLSGSGFLELTAGTSERVRDGFWTPSEDPAWQDLRRDHVFLSADETVEIFQRLVDAGFFDYRPDPARNPPPHDLAILVSIGFRKRLLLTGRDDYRAIFERLLERVHRP